MGMTRVIGVSGESYWVSEHGDTMVNAVGEKMKTYDTRKTIIQVGSKVFDPSKRKYCPEDTRQCEGYPEPGVHDSELCGCPPTVLMDCPACKRPHEDRGEFATRVHKTHFCEHCSYTWTVDPPVFGAVRP